MTCSSAWRSRRVRSATRSIVRAHAPVPSARKLRGVEAVDSGRAEQLLEIDAEMLAETPAELTEE